MNFLAPDEQGVMQLYSVDTNTLTRSQITRSATAVSAYAAGAGQVVFYREATLEHRRIISVDRPLQEILGGDLPGARAVELVALNLTNGRERLLSDAPFTLWPWHRKIWLSPDATRAFVLVPGLPDSGAWSRFKRSDGSALVQHGQSAFDFANVPRLARIDLKTDKVVRISDAPAGEAVGKSTEILWCGRSTVVRNTYLPPGSGVGAGGDFKDQFGEIILSEDTPRILIRSLRETHIPTTNRNRAVSCTNLKSQTERFSLSLRTGLNDLPRLTYRADGRDRELFDPNPQLKDVAWGRTERVTWRDGQGRPWSGLVVYPPDYDERRRYPLIMQTHGASNTDFLFDGPDGITTAMAAQAFAGAGYVVAQVDEGPFISGTAAEAKDVADGYEQLIKELESRGVADPKRVGLIAFSRTGLHAIQLLAKRPATIAALVTADAPWWGYVNDTLFGPFPTATAREIAQVTGSDSYGTERLTDFSDYDPLYAAARSDVPIRIEANSEGSLLGYWELFTSRKRLGKPTELIYFEGATHNLQMPDERLASQTGTLQWFNRWLKPQ